MRKCETSVRGVKANLLSPSVPHLDRPWCAQQSGTSVQSCRIASSAASRRGQPPCSRPPSYWCNSWAQGGRTLGATRLEGRRRRGMLKIMFSYREDDNKIRFIH